MALTIELNALEKRFANQQQPAVACLTATLRSGGITGLVGPDGAGKTTLLRMLAGLLTPSSGQLSVAGLDPQRDHQRLRTILGYMPQKFGLYEDLSVMENLNLYADLRSVMGSERQQILQQLLAFTDLGRFTQRLAGKLSGGMKQKLGLACSLLGQPQILLLDEPGVGVDPISRRELWQMVHQLANDGMLILWSTAYLDEAEQCREVLLMNQGQLLFSGAPATLTERMAERTLLIEPSTLSPRQWLPRVLSLEGVSDAVLQGKYLRLILRAGADAKRVLQQLAIPEIVPLTTEARFEDAFIDLLGGQIGSESALAKVIPMVTASDSAAVIEAEQLTKKFGDFVATDQVSFAVQRGEIFGLLGPNGAGKSTTFKMMCGLLQPTTGNAKVLGLDLQHSSGRARQHLGYMAQKFSLYGNLSVAQNLKFFSGVYGLSGRVQRERINQMCQVFHFGPLLNQATETLPLGFKQRLALACALMHQPEILFLDEPTSGVDPLTRREFWLHINGMVERGVTVMVTTHFMDEAEYCDRIGLVYRGKIIASGTPDDLKQQAASTHNPAPSMEQTFIELVQRYDLESTDE
ncbi:ATP-binding cassette domain-containing protein [Serratia microhaemolytica]|uniref:ATP-binding cassette domain-containing protein n=1 Tax=Serratia microhaemolytica TaxID=2675110 RepID=UPI000FDEF38C|nr:ATP-binding cassette domain-containing protein [Serratia microhaemolytica]